MGIHKGLDGDSGKGVPSEVPSETTKQQETGGWSPRVLGKAGGQLRILLAISEPQFPHL